MNNPESLIGIIVGLFAMICSYMDFDFFMNHHKARFFINLFGRNGTRAFYFALGFFLLIVGFGTLK